MVVIGGGGCGGRKGVGARRGGHPHTCALDADVLQQLSPVGQAGRGGVETTVRGTSPHDVATRQKVELLSEAVQTHADTLC